MLPFVRIQVFLSAARDNLSELDVALVIDSLGKGSSDGKNERSQYAITKYAHHLLTITYMARLCRVKHHNL